MCVSIKEDGLHLRALREFVVPEIPRRQRDGQWNEREQRLTAFIGVLHKPLFRAPDMTVC